MLGRLARGVIACAVLSAGLLVAGRLRAQELGPILLSYRAAPGCPPVAEFQRSVKRRSTRVHFVDEGTHDRELSVVLRKDGSYTTGELRLIERDGSLRQRIVRFTTCPEAVDGLALITAVSLDPHALLEPPAPANTAPAATNPAPLPAPKTPQSGVPMAVRPPPIAAPRRQGLELALGLELSGLFRALPATALGGALFLDVASRSQSWLAPLVRVAVSHTERRGLAEGNFEANFALTLATLSACPLRFGGNLLAFRPCAFVSGGAVRAWGSQTPNPQTHTLQHWSWGGNALFFLRASEVTEIVGDVGGGVALVRDQFTFDQTQFSKTPALYLSTNVGIRFAFP